MKPCIPLSIIATTLALLQPLKADESVRPVSRANWNARNPVKAIPDQFADNTTIKYISLHHTESSPTHKTLSEAELLKNVQAGHMFYNGHIPPEGETVEPKYGDIAYHYIVGFSGSIYEGRSPEKAAASYTHYLAEDEFEGAKWVGGRVVPSSKVKVCDGRPGATAGHITVSFLCGLKGTPQMPPEIARQNAAKWIATLLVKYKLTPKDVRAHREVANTECPGDTIYTWLRGPSKSRTSLDGDGMKMIISEYEKLKG